MERNWRVEVVTLILYFAIFLSMDKARGLRMAAGWYLRGAHVMRDLSNWSGTIAIRWDNAAKELISP